MRMRLTATIVITAVLAGLSIGAVQGPPSAPRQDLPTDKKRQQEIEITQAAQEYTVDFRGTVDGAMTRMPVSYSAYGQGWQPNEFARIENVGETDVVNPWITVNGRGDWRTIQSIVTEAMRGCTTDADKARAIWEWQRSHRFHACTWDGEVDDAVKALNVYGYTLCGDEALVLKDLWKAAGFRVRPGHPIGHAVSEVFYDGAWHLLDSDENTICLKRDNKTIASEAEVVRDHDLMKRTHTYGLSEREDALNDQSSAALYSYEGERSGEASMDTRHTMHFVLRPGEALEWRWSHAGKEYSNGTDLKPGEVWTTDGTGHLLAWGDTAYADLRNGKWIYRPPLDKALYRKGIISEENVACAAEDKQPGNLHPAKLDKPATVTWKIASPYVIVGAKINCAVKGNAGALQVRFSNDGATWQDLPAPAAGEKGELSFQLDKLLSPRGKPMYAYYAQVVMQAGAALDAIVFDTDVQMSLLGMPELTVGTNRVRYVDETPAPAERKVKVTHAWMERTAWHAPAAVAEAISPKDGETVSGTNVTFRWTPPAVGDASDKIVDYQIQVCEREDLRWAISPTFDKLISKTLSTGKAQWTTPFAGLLNPDTPYYWRVRAKDSKGVWGAWSRAFSFRCAAPGVPVNVRLVGENGVPEALEWDAPAAGAEPMGYRIYGSDEQGFTVSDTEYILRMGNGFCRTMDEFNAKKPGDRFVGDIKTPPNFITQTSQRQVELAAPLCAFYRVVALTDSGIVSGASDAVELPRPFIYSRPLTGAKVGQVYDYRPAATASIGHLTCRDGYNAAFWQREMITWTLGSSPKWLTIKDGILTGTPADTDVGTCDIVLKLTNSNNQLAEQRFRIVVAK